MQKVTNQFTDGFASLERGMDSGRSPSLLARNQYALGINTTVRGGFITHRPGFRRIPLQFLDEDGAADATLRERAVDGRFQGAAYFSPANGNAGLAYSVSGRQFMVTIAPPESTENTVLEFTPRHEDDSDDDPHGDINNPLREQVWMCQAEDFLIVQDNQSLPIIYNGSSSRRAHSPSKEVPTGSVMAYGLGRLWVARGRNFVASDIVNGPSGTSTYARRDAVLKFTENDYLNEGGSFRAPAPVTAMAFPSNLDTALGEGELTVFYRSGASVVRVPASRDDWKNLSIPLQRTALKPKGATSQNSVVEVNSDLFFRSDDGIRSFVMAQRQFGQWGNTPSSLEVDRLLKSDDRRLLNHASAALFDNRLLMTTSAVRDAEHGVYFRGLIALNFDSVSGMFEKLPPAYDGVWTGLNILQVVSGEFHGQERCFVFALSDQDEIELWELTTADYLDRYDHENSTRIVWAFETSSRSFEDAGDGIKRLTAGRLFIDQLRGDATFTVKYRPDQYPLWLQWSDSWTKRAAHQACNGWEGCLPEIPLPQHRTNMALPRADRADESTNNLSLDQGHEFQFRIQVQGSCRIRRMRLRADVVQEKQDGGCPRTDSEELSLTGCDEEIFSYQLTTPETPAATTSYILDDDGGRILDDDMNPILGD